ncbi:hypothetical protein [Galactobacillus timonensis]|uniref:hypothetical protein n=1 Tax=Galactobacillus timonensis TaxID=2041840 RepID=UPI0010838C11|nr:hypothetical protein [Galactobacillus timonensis]
MLAADHGEPGTLAQRCAGSAAGKDDETMLRKRISCSLLRIPERYYQLPHKYSPAPHFLDSAISALILSRVIADKPFLQLSGWHASRNETLKHLLDRNAEIRIFVTLTINHHRKISIKKKRPPRQLPNNERLFS